MATTKSKKRLILDLGQARRLERAEESDLRAIESDLRRLLGAGQKTSLSYIANVLAEAGVRVDFNSPFVDPWMEEPYRTRLKGVLHFHGFAEAEAALRKLDEAFREYRAASDRVGADLVHNLMVKGRRRAESVASSPRVSPEKREEKQEIALWFKIWLELPDSFFDWLDMRKRSADFERGFGKQNPAG